MAPNADGSTPEAAAATTTTTTTAPPASATPQADSKLAHIMDVCACSRAQAHEALTVCEGDVDRAIQLLLEG